MTFRLDFCLHPVVARRVREPKIDVLNRQWNDLRHIEETVILIHTGTDCFDCIKSQGFLTRYAAITIDSEIISASRVV